MKTYDEFLTWAANHHYQLWINDYDFVDDADRVAWGHLQHSVINTASAIYEIHHFDIYHAFQKRLDELYGNPLTCKAGTMKTWD